MIRGYLDRLMRPRDLVLRFRLVKNPEETTGPLAGVPGLLTTEQRLQPGDLDRVRKIDVRDLVDGQVVKIKR